jgi:hypothetical protein
LPPDGPEPSELDEALFGAVPDAGGARVQPRPSPAGEDAALDDALFGNEWPEPTVASRTLPTRASQRAAKARGWRIALAGFAVLLVLGIGGAGYAMLGTGDDTSSNAPKVEVRGTQVTSTTTSTTTTVAPTTVPIPAAPTVPTTPPTAPPTAPPTTPRTAPPTEPPTEPPTVPTTTPPTTEPPTTTVPPTTTTYRFVPPYTPFP